MNKQTFIPEGYNAVMPALAIQNAGKALNWYKDIFNAKENMVLRDPTGIIVHAELIIADSVLMLAEENPQYNKSPKTLGGNTINLYMYVQDVDTVIQKALEEGAKLIMPVAEQFYGDRVGRIEDPFGYIWSISTHIKDIPGDEMQKMMEETMNQTSQ